MEGFTALIAVAISIALVASIVGRMLVSMLPF
jgi:hypothetical protein